MNIETFDQLPREFPRRFLPADADLSDLETVLAQHRRLEEFPLERPEDFADFSEALFELRTALHEAHSKYHIISTCHTDDEDIAACERHFTNQIFPGCAEISHRLDLRFVEAGPRLSVDSSRFATILRSREADIRLFRKENIPLTTELANLAQKYFAIRGAVTVDFEGRERTMSEMFKYLESPDRDLRERAWRTRQIAELQVREEIDALFDRMLVLRDQLARNAGFSSFTDYMFHAYKRFDYTPADCLEFHQAIEEVVVPLLTRIHEDKRRRLGLDRLRPWDIHVDPQGSEPLAPFADANELIRRMRRLMGRLDGDFDRWFTQMDRYGLLDLASRKGKAPGGYSATLSERRYPFIFMNATGTDWDVRVLLHELGHAFHSFSLRGDLLNYAAHSPMEFNEVASMSLELLGSGFLDEFYPREEDLARSNARLLERIVALFTSVATIDSFQHGLYARPGQDRQTRDAAWTAACDRFSSGVIDWSGCKKFRGHGWQAILHIINLPFYYVEYGIAQLGALQVWRNARRDFPTALAAYKQGLAAGNTLTLPQLYARTGIRFDFSREMVSGLMDEVATARFGPAEKAAC